jgi:hypothetical protein
MDYNIKSKSYLKIKKRLHTDLKKQQFGSSIKKNNFIIMDLDYKNGGFGSQINTIAFCLKLGLLFNRTVIFDFKNFGYANLFEDLSNIKIETVNKFEKVPLDFEKKQEDKVVYFDFPQYFHKSKKLFYEWIPNYWLKSGFDKDLFEGEVLSTIKIKNEELKKIKEIEKEIGFKKPIIGVQIRRADKYTESKPVTINSFFNKIKYLSEEKSIINVFVTSDSDKTFSELPKNYKFNYIFDKNEKRYDAANHIIASKNKKLGYQEAFTGLKIIYLLSNCDYLVGQKNTHLMDIASKLKLVSSGSKNLYLVDFEYYSDNIQDFFVKKIVRVKRLFEKLRLSFIR